MFSVLDIEEKKNSPGANKAPYFGESDSSYDTVKSFYSYWQSFSTTKSFSWKDVYKISEAPNRQIRRIMEKENKKERDKAKKAYNDLVKRLVVYVKKQDRRLLEYVRLEQEEYEAKEAKKKEEQMKNKESMKAALAEARKQAEERLDNLDLNEFDTDMIMDDRDKQKVGLVDNEILELYCYACKKKFKSDKQWANHEKSKKHIIAVEKMRAELLVEEDLEEDSLDIMYDENTNESEGQDLSSLDEDIEAVDENSTTSMDRSNNSFEGNVHANNEDQRSEEEEDDEDFYMQMMMRNNNKNKFSMFEGNDESEEEEEEEKPLAQPVLHEEPEDTMVVKSKKKKARRNKKK